MTQVLINEMRKGDSRFMQEVHVLTVRELYEAERERLINLQKENPEWWTNKFPTSWASILYGDNLELFCQICGETFNIDEKFIVLKYSFYDEYTCQLMMHYHCPLLKKLEEEFI